MTTEIERQLAAALNDLDVGVMQPSMDGQHQCFVRANGKRLSLEIWAAVDLARDIVNGTTVAPVKVCQTCANWESGSYPSSSPKGDCVALPPFMRDDRYNRLTYEGDYCGMWKEK